jgi:transposase
MSEQIHKRLTDEQVRMILSRYVANEMKTSEAMELLGIKRRQFFEWVQRYRKDPACFTVRYNRDEKNRKLDDTINKCILKELAIEKALIDNHSMPIRFYNYSYIQDQIKKNHQKKVSLPTIIDRAKKTVSISPNQRKLFTTMR